MEKDISSTDNMTIEETDKKLEHKQRRAHELAGEKLCPDCNKFFHWRGFKAHTKNCKTRQVDEARLQEEKENGFKCPHCEKPWPSSKARNGHAVRCKLNPKRKDNVAKAAKSNRGKKVSKEGKENISKGKKESAKRSREISNDGHLYTEKIRDADGNIWKIHLNDGLPD